MYPYTKDSRPIAEKQTQKSTPPHPHPLKKMAKKSWNKKILMRLLEQYFELAIVYKKTKFVNFETICAWTLINYRDLKKC